MVETTMHGTSFQSSGGVTSGTVAVQQPVGPNTTISGHVSGYHHGGQTHVTGGGIGFSYNFRDK